MEQGGRASQKNRGCPEGCRAVHQAGMRGWAIAVLRGLRQCCIRNLGSDVCGVGCIVFV